MDILTKVFKWHERTTEYWVNKFGLSQYQSLWLAWFKGIFTVLIFINYGIGFYLDVPYESNFIDLFFYISFLF